jgi:alpha-tubulin suppressor-like RCC1 family protein
MCGAQLTQMEFGTDSYVAIVAGIGHIGVLLANGTVFMWGANFYGELGFGESSVGNTVSTPTVLTAFPMGTVVLALAAGGFFSGAIASDTTLYMWGSNECGQLGTGTTADAYQPTEIGFGYTALSLSVYHTCALQGTILFCWGSNWYGELSNPTTTFAYPTPYKVAAFSNVVAVSCGYCFTLAMLSGGTVWAWGLGMDGQLGQGSVGIQSNPIPVLVPLPYPVTKVTTGQSHACAIVHSGNVYCWGDNTYGQLGNGTQDTTVAPVLVSGVTSVTDIGAGVAFTFAVMSGVLYGWGNDGLCSLMDVTKSKTNQLTPAALPLPSAVSIISVGVASYMGCAVVDSAS